MVMGCSEKALTVCKMIAWHPKPTASCNEDLPHPGSIIVRGRPQSSSGTAALFDELS